MKQQEKIKNSTFAKASVDKQISKFKIFILPVLRSLGVGGLLAFCFLNLAYSQIISPIYFQFVNNDKDSTISFLQKIKGLPDYQKILKMNNDIYGSSVKEEIFKQENKKKEMINYLEQQLTINPKAREVLYSLFQLYLEEGDKNLAEDYLRRAKEVDPMINPTNTTNPDQSDQ